MHAERAHSDSEVRLCRGGAVRLGAAPQAVDLLKETSCLVLGQSVAHT